MSSTNSSSSPTDVLVIGAGPAGLTVALGISRLLHTCIIFSSSKFRNDLSKHMHGVPTWEHRDPAEFRKATQEDILAHYDTATFEDAIINKIEKTERANGTSLFRAVEDNGKEWWGRKVVLASGITDIMLDIPGYAENWAHSIFHCLFCHGYEERGASSAGLLAIDDLETPFAVIHIARFANRLASKVTVYTNANPAVTETLQSAFTALNPQSKTARNITIESRKIIKFVKGQRNAEIEVHFEDGESKVEGFIAHKPKGVPNGGWIGMLGLETTPQGMIKGEGFFNETSVKGVFAAGDCTIQMQSVASTIGQAPLVVAGVCGQLGEED